MRKRMRLNKKKSRKVFSKTSARTNARNFRGSPMRGGIRL